MGAIVKFMGDFLEQFLSKASGAYLRVSVSVLPTYSIFRVISQYSRDICPSLAPAA